jgi:hypothetical protein
MGLPYSNEQIASLAARAALLLSLSLGGCANSNSSVMDARADASVPEQKYMVLEAPTPTREIPAMTVDEQSKLKNELIDVRDRQAALVKARDNVTTERFAKPDAL